MGFSILGWLKGMLALGGAVGTEAEKPEVVKEPTPEVKQVPQRGPNGRFIKKPKE